MLANSLNLVHGIDLSGIILALVVLRVLLVEGRKKAA